MVIELPPGIGIVWRELLILFHQLCPELLLCLRFLRFMVGVVLVVVRKGHNAPLEVVHQDVTETVPLGEAILSPDTFLFLGQCLDQLLLPMELDGGHRHGNHVFIAHIAVIPLLQPGENGQIQIQSLFIVHVEVGDLSLDRCYLMGIFTGKAFQGVQGFFFAVHNLIADHTDFFWQFHDIHDSTSFCDILSYLGYKITIFCCDCFRLDFGW